MRKEVLFVIMILLGCFRLHAQLYVSPNSYMYVSNNYLFVKQDVNLQIMLLYILGMNHNFCKELQVHLGIKG